VFVICEGKRSQHRRFLALGMRFKKLFSAGFNSISGGGGGPSTGHTHIGVLFDLQSDLLLSDELFIGTSVLV
jgi:hypothetical protein